MPPAYSPEGERPQAMRASVGIAEISQWIYYEAPLASLLGQHSLCDRSAKRAMLCEAARSGNDRMCSVLTHPAVPIALMTVLPQEALSPTLLLVGIACSVIPDLDVIGFKFGITSDHMLGHRGLTHSIVFAATLGALLTYTLFRTSHPSPWIVCLFLFLSTLSHPLLDMLTNGGRGVALWAPFSNARYFFPWRPIEVSPVSVRRFFSRRGVQIIRSELRWVWLPAAAVVILGMIVRQYG